MTGLPSADKDNQQTDNGDGNQPMPARCVLQTRYAVRFYRVKDSR